MGTQEEWLAKRLDLLKAAPKGRNEQGFRFRHHDRYGN
jgi:hypothetical protein